ncbi:MAG: matrixin family metalloprotease [Acidimicrobiia bacterium]
MAGHRGRGRDEFPSTPGWYPDPWSATGTGERYFDGRTWGSTERPRGRHTVVEKPEKRGRADAPDGDGSPRRLRGGLRWVVVIAVIAAVVGVLTWVQESGSSSDGGSSAAGGAAPVASGAPGTTAPSPFAVAAGQPHPTPVKKESAQRLLPLPPEQVNPGDYQLLVPQRDDPGAPAGFDPCRPIHYVVNPDGAPPDGVAMVQDAFAKVSAATGLQFVDDGTTDELPAKERDGYQPDRYGDRWAPILVAWSDEARFPPLAGIVAGIGSPFTVQTNDGHLTFTSGQAVFDTEVFDPVAHPERAQIEAVVLHELGHVMGLDHTADRGQIMFSEAQFDVTEFGSGDLAGLRAVGSARCEPGI